MRVPVVVDQQSDDFAPLVTPAYINCQLISDRSEGPLLEQALDKTVPDLELQVFERAV